MTGSPKDDSATPLSQKLGAKPGDGVVVLFTTKKASKPETDLVAWGVVGGGVLAGKYASTNGRPRRYDGVGPRGQASGQAMLELAAELDR